MQCASKMCFIILLEQIKEKKLVWSLLFVTKRVLESGFVQSMFTVLSTLYLNIVRETLHSLVVLSTGKPSFTAWYALISVDGE